MVKKQKFESSCLDEVDRTMYDAFRGAANSLFQLYTHAMNHQRVSFLASERPGMRDKLCFLPFRGASAFAISMSPPGLMNLSSHESVKKWSDWKEDRCQSSFRLIIIQALSCLVMPVFTSQVSSNFLHIFGHVTKSCSYSNH
ncbi:hypothetical protein AALP_AAs40079U000200 [Arabis alpina]|uniref:Uncharacterized protein n=1 Tax=Arabis alpina TaxID=50452 RepID=A0A087G136_ARAAL|nr:hypothetical protein AALP_AAs40079U000200 [Arabis alpina]